MGAPTIRVDHDLCVGSQICLLTAPATFALDDGGQSVVVDPTGDAPDVVLEAAEGCPLEAITVIDETGRQVFP